MNNTSIYHSRRSAQVVMKGEPSKEERLNALRTKALESCPINVDSAFARPDATSIHPDFRDGGEGSVSLRQQNFSD